MKKWVLITIVFLFSLFFIQNVEAQATDHFNLTGTIINSTYGNASNANVTIYIVTRDNFGGITKTLNGSDTTDHNGVFNLTGINKSTNVD